MRIGQANQTTIMRLNFNLHSSNCNIKLLTVYIMMTIYDVAVTSQSKY